MWDLLQLLVFFRFFSVIYPTHSLSTSCFSSSWSHPPPSPALPIVITCASPAFVLYFLVCPSSPFPPAHMILSLFRMTVCKNQKSFPLVTKLKHKLLENDVFFLAVEHDRYNDFDTVVIKTRSGVNIKKIYTVSTKY